MLRQVQEVVIVVNENLPAAIVFFVNSIVLAIIRLIYSMRHSLHSPIYLNRTTTYIQLLSAISGLYSVCAAVGLCVLSAFPSTRPLSRELMGLSAPTLIVIPVICLRKPVRVPRPLSNVLPLISGHSVWPSALFMSVTCGFSIATSILNQTWSFTGLYITGPVILLIGPKARQEVQIGDDGDYHSGTYRDVTTLLHNKHIDAFLVQEMGLDKISLWEESAGLKSKHNDLLSLRLTHRGDLLLSFEGIHFNDDDMKLPESIPLLNISDEGNQTTEDGIPVYERKHLNIAFKNKVGFMSEAELLKHLNKPTAKSTKFAENIFCETSLSFGKSDLKKSLLLIENIAKYDGVQTWISWFSIWQFAQMMFQKNESVRERSRNIPKYLDLQYQKAVQEAIRLTSTAVREADSILKSQSYQSPMYYAVELLETLGLWGAFDSRQLHKFWFVLLSEYAERHVGRIEYDVIHLARLSLSNCNSFEREETEILVWPSSSRTTPGNEPNSVLMKFVSEETAKSIEGNVLRLNFSGKSLDTTIFSSLRTVTPRVNAAVILDQASESDLYSDGLFLTEKVQLESNKIESYRYRSGFILSQSLEFSTNWEKDSELNRSFLSRVLSEVAVIQTVVSGIAVGGVLASYVLGG